MRRRAEPAPVARTPEEEQEHEVALVIQGQYRRRIGETLEIVNAAGNIETVRIQNINAGDDHAEVIIVHANKRIETIPAMHLAEKETLAAERAATATGGASRVIRLGNAAEVTDIAGSTKKKFKMRYGAVDVSDAVEERARDSAEEELHREKAELAGISGGIAKIWKHNVAYEIYRQVGIARARNKILTDKNLYTNEGLQKADHQRAVAAVVDRFVEGHQNSLHQQGADGERKKKLETSTAEVAVKAKLNDLVREFAVNPAMDEDELEKRKLSIFKEANELAGEAKGRGVMVADNMIEIAKAVREHALHAGGIDNLDIDLEFVIGKAKMGARTEQEKNAIDKALEGMDRLTSKHGITAGIWGATRSGAAVAGAIGLTMAQMMAKSNIAKLATFGGSAIATGLFGWWREKGRTNREHALHERQRALGGLLRAEQTQPELDAEEIQLNRQFIATKWWQPVERANLRARIAKVRDTKQPRREKMDEFALNRVNARDLSDRGQAFLTPDGQLKPGLDPADAMRALADMEARVSIGNIEKKDLLQYSGVAEVEIERRDLDETRIVLKAALRAANANFEFDYDSIYNGVVGAITVHKDTQQRKYDEYAKKRAKNAALIAVGSGLAVGFGAHEIWAWATDNESVTESLGKAGTWLMNYLNNTPVAPTMPNGAPELHAFADGAITTPPGTELILQADGSWSLQAAADHRVIADGLKIGSNGSLDAASVQALENLGGTVAQQDVMTDHVTTVSEEVGVWDWLRGHAPSVTSVHRDIWMGNDTPMYFSAELQKWLGADFNELKLDWGKMGGISPDGKSFVMDMSKMTPGGSWNGAVRADAPAELLEGKIRLVLSMSESSQNHAVEIVVDQNGQAVIPMDSDIGRTFFTMHDGHAVFTGKYAEIAVSKGFDAQGTDHLAILATHTGKGLDHGITTRDLGECVEKHLTEIRLPSGDIDTFPPIVLPPIIPIRARTPMERLATRKPGLRGRFAGPIEEETERGSYYYTSYYNGGNGREVKKDRIEIAQMRLSHSPELTAEMVQQFRELNAQLADKYSFVLRRFDELRSYSVLKREQQAVYQHELGIYNVRYFGNDTNRYISIEEFVGRQIARSHRQLENILMEEASVGSRPFVKDFYSESPMVKGMERAEEIIVVLEPAIGDTVLTVPVINVIDTYLQQKGQSKKIVLVTANVKLLSSLESQFNGRVEVIPYTKAASRFAEKKERYLVNVNAWMDDYSDFGIEPEDWKDPSHVLSVEWSSWVKEEAPVKEGYTKKYDPIPARIMRDFELMLGQKLFEDIHKIDHYIERGPNFDTQAAALRAKYGIKPGEKIIAITYGSQVKPKEYHPDQWKEVLKLIFAKYKNAHILWLESPEAAKRDEYAIALEGLTEDQGYKISRVTEGMDYMNTIMSMSDLSITPDTGLGHFSGAVGTPNVMLTLVDPVQWSTAKTNRVMHPKAYETYKQGKGSYALMWQQPKGFYVEEDGKQIGASNIKPEQVFEKVEKILG